MEPKYPIHSRSIETTKVFGLSFSFHFAHELDPTHWRVNWPESAVVEILLAMLNDEIYPTFWGWNISHIRILSIVE